LAYRFIHGVGTLIDRFEVKATPLGDAIPNAEYDRTATVKAVKTARQRHPYDASRRQEQARRSRDRIIDAAERRFLRHGYGLTTIAAIADDVGVSVDTIYKAFGGKPGLVRAIRNRALEGKGPVPAEQESDDLQAREPDARKIVESWGRFVTEIAPLAAPILLLIRSAADTDPDVQALLEELDADRLRRMTDNARRLHEAGHLRPGVSIAQAADVLWTYSSAELYELLVLRRGMPLKQYGRFVANAHDRCPLKGWAVTGLSGDPRIADHCLQLKLRRHRLRKVSYPGFKRPNVPTGLYVGQYTMRWWIGRTARTPGAAFSKSDSSTSTSTGFRVHRWTTS
jgi:AcrR family transcriptional regulator